MLNKQITNISQFAKQKNYYKYSLIISITLVIANARKMHSNKPNRSN